MKVKYKIISLFIIFLMIFAFINNCNATGIWETSKKFLDEGLKDWSSTSTSGLINKLIGMQDVSKSGFEKLIDFLWGIGLLVIFITSIILGIKYMLVNPDEKSRIKQATTPYVVGVVIIFGALTIWKLIITILESALI